uniref:RNA-directed DNA polymerase, eukaryota, reverse transcriptase zinc-binding domain protein n=1 Tax=Tanacetum cinerariifolium TaxID=118510 RepID=A0A6L2JMM3_TANCI|nr:RNA-directed DNA polymerase, eukaryota, reverse transcriptase zinc-binding domain protein [Tanacetum cinerariifolium]
MALILMAKAFKLNYSTPTKNNQRISSNLRNRQIAQPRMNIRKDRQMKMVRAMIGINLNGMLGRMQEIRLGIANQNANQNGNGNVVAARVEGNDNGNNGNHIKCYNYRGLGHYARNYTVRPRRRDGDIDEIEKVNANCILMANLQPVSTSSTQTDKAPIYDSDGSAETLYNQPSTMELNSETPIVKSVDINAKLTSYAGATGASTKDQTKVEANFRSLLADKVFNGVNISIPLKVFEKVSVRFENTLYGYFIGNRMDFLVVEYYTLILGGGANLKESITMGIPDLDGPGFTTKTIRVEYEWKPPRWKTCNIFGHMVKSCPKKVVTTLVVNDTNDGFQQVVNKKRNHNRNLAGKKLPKGVLVVKGFQVGKDFTFQPRAPKASSNSGGTHSENIRGFNQSPNQKEVHQVVNENNLSVCAILESHVDVASVYDTCKKVCRRPWVFMGDFNVALNLEDHYSGGYEPNVDMRKFKECVQTIEVVKSSWNVSIEGFAMYRVVKRLKGLKSSFCKLLHDHGNLHERVNRICVELDEAKKYIDMDPSSSILREENAHYLLSFKEAWLDEEIVKSKCTKNRIDMVSDSSNTLYDEGLGDNVSINQSAFVPGRRISNNILFTQVLMRNYHRRCGPPRFASKADIQKAYDMVDWMFLETSSNELCYGSSNFDVVAKGAFVLYAAWTLYLIGLMIAFIVPISKGKTIINILSRIVVAATSYYIWLERNGRLFKEKTLSPDQIVQVILSMVWLKLVTFKFKKMSTRSYLLLDQWKIPSYYIAHDGSFR